jgi:hypothetical protein
MAIFEAAALVQAHFSGSQSASRPPAFHAAPPPAQLESRRN